MIDLRCGNALELMPSIPNASIDAIITDLPYGTTQCKWDTIIPFAPMWEQVKRILKPRGAFVTTVASRLHARW
jgi:DNA modification methylase